MDLVSVSDAARRLGVSRRQVERLAASGRLSLVAPGRLDSLSVARFAAERRGVHRRSWSEATAWGALALLSGVPAEWLEAVQRSRVRRVLRSSAAEELVARVRNRAEVRVFAAHESVLGRVAGRVVSAGGEGARLGLVAASGRVDGYVSSGGAAELVQRFGLEAAVDGAVTLRVTGFDLGVLEQLAAAGDVVAAVDLATSVDPRERHAGLAGVGDALGRFCG